MSLVRRAVPSSRTEQPEHPPSRLPLNHVVHRVSQALIMEVHRLRKSDRLGEGDVGCVGPSEGAEVDVVAAVPSVCIGASFVVQLTTAF
jgi:hypothetical protein